VAEIPCCPVAVGVYWTVQIEGVPPLRVHVPTLKVPVPVFDQVTVPVGGTSDLPVTVSATVAVQLTVWVGATAVGPQTTDVVVGSWVTVMVKAAAVLLVAWMALPP